jgi:hypothetical protein
LFVCFNIPFNLISLNYTMNKLFIIGSENQNYFYDNRPFTDFGYDFKIDKFYKSYLPYRWTKGSLFMQEQWPKHSVCIYLYFVNTVSIHHLQISNLIPKLDTFTRVMSLIGGHMFAVQCKSNYQNIPLTCIFCT